MPLDETYSSPAIHCRWREVYFRGARQARFDDRIYDWVFRMASAPGAWLDAGCGTGEHTVRLARHARAIVGVDISQAALDLAREQVNEQGVGGRVRLTRGALETLGTLPEVSHVHCRGVLMHIPEWEAALRNLCGLVKPGGYLVLFEGNRRSLEAWIVRLVRLLRRTSSRLSRTRGGWEYWSERDGRPFVARMADRGALIRVLEDCGIEAIGCRPVFFIDPNRLPRRVREWCVPLNRLWFTARLPLAAGFVLVGKKKPAG